MEKCQALSGTPWKSHGIFIPKCTKPDIHTYVHAYMNMYIYLFVYLFIICEGLCVGYEGIEFPNELEWRKEAIRSVNAPTARLDLEVVAPNLCIVSHGSNPYSLLNQMYFYIFVDVSICLNIPDITFAGQSARGSLGRTLI